MLEQKATSQIVQGLDCCIVKAHELRFAGKKYHPYFLAADLATLLSLVFIALFTRRFPVLDFWKMAAVYAAMVLIYQGYLRAKAKWFGIRSRSFLQDSLLFLLPTYALIHWALGHPVGAALDLAGILLPLYAGTVRMGCFLSGCCYGVPYSGGVLYPESIFVRQEGCRRFQPGALPPGRVLPVQLIESFAQYSLAAGLIAFEWGGAEPRGALLVWYLLSYSLIRFPLDFLRQSSARPRIGRLSEAQVFCIITSAICLIVLGVL